MADPAIQTANGFGSPIAFGSNNTAGNSIVVAIYLSGGGAAPTVTDSNGNTYVLVANLGGYRTGGNTAAAIALYYALSIAGGANSVSFSGGGPTVIVELPAATGIRGTGTTSSGSTGTPSATIAGSVAGDVCFAFLDANGNSQSAGTFGSNPAYIQTTPYGDVPPQDGFAGSNGVTFTGTGTSGLGWGIIALAFAPPTSSPVFEDVISRPYPIFVSLDPDHRLISSYYDDFPGPSLRALEEIWQAPTFASFEPPPYVSRFFEDIPSSVIPVEDVGSDNCSTNIDSYSEAIRSQEDAPFLYGPEDTGIDYCVVDLPLPLTPVESISEDTPFLYGTEDTGQDFCQQNVDFIAVAPLAPEDYAGPPALASEDISGLSLQSANDAGHSIIVPQDDFAQSASQALDDIGTISVMSAPAESIYTLLSFTDERVPVPSAFGFDEANAVARFDAPPDANAGVVPEEMAFLASQLHIDEPTGFAPSPPDERQWASTQPTDDYASSFANEDLAAIAKTDQEATLTQAQSQDEYPPYLPPDETWPIQIQAPSTETPIVYAMAPESAIVTSLDDSASPLVIMFPILSDRSADGWHDAPVTIPPAFGFDESVGLVYPRESPDWIIFPWSDDYVGTGVSPSSFALVILVSEASYTSGVGWSYTYPVNRSGRLRSGESMLIVTAELSEQP